MGVLEFLRDVGKHVTVNPMLAKESVRARVESEDGISFTEFSYMLLQANDYDVLHQRARLRAAGRRLGPVGQHHRRHRPDPAPTGRPRSTASPCPLVTRSDGAKFGKSAEGAVWLSPARTSPYAFYQYWINIDDRDVERFLLQLTLLPVAEAVAVAAEHAAAPERREGQRRLAHEMTGAGPRPSPPPGRPRPPRSCCSAAIRPTRTRPPSRCWPASSVGSS